MSTRVLEEEREEEEREGRKHRGSKGREEVRLDSWKKSSFPLPSKPKV